MCVSLGAGMIFIRPKGFCFLTSDELFPYFIVYKNIDLELLGINN